MENGIVHQKAHADTPPKWSGWKKNKHLLEVARVELSYFKIWFLNTLGEKPYW